VTLVSSPPRALLPDLVLAHHGLGPATKKRSLTRATRRRPRKPPGSLWVESRFLFQNLRLVLQLLHQGLRRASRSSDRKDTLIFNIFFYSLPINLQASMQSASKYPFGLTSKEPCSQEQVPKGGQAPESFCWKDLSRNVKAPRPIRH
jgi:hypothetical protein